MSAGPSQDNQSAAAAYWRENIRILLSLLAIWFAVSFGCGILFVVFLVKNSLNSRLQPMNNFNNKVAVIVGVIVSALIFAWKHAKDIQIEKQEDQDGSTVYKVHGLLFFGSTTHFLEQFSPKLSFRASLVHSI